MISVFMCFYTPAEGMMISVGGYNDFSPEGIIISVRGLARQ